MEEQIIKDLISKSLIHLELNDEFCFKQTYVHPQHKNLEFIFELKKDCDREDDYFLVYFIVSKNTNNYCKSRILEGSKNEVLNLLRTYIKDLSLLIKDLPNYYRILFCDN